MPYPALQAIQGHFLSQSPTDATSGEVAFEWELTKETIDLPLGCLQGGTQDGTSELSTGVTSDSDVRKSQHSRRTLR